MRDREKERNIRLPESYVQQGGPVRPPRPSRARRAAHRRAQQHLAQHLRGLEPAAAQRHIQPVARDHVRKRHRHAGEKSPIAAALHRRAHAQHHGQRLEQLIQQRQHSVAQPRGQHQRRDQRHAQQRDRRGGEQSLQNGQKRACPLVRHKTKPPHRFFASI